ncbi:hypothetical protein [Dictyobacter aurantiacus]|nr:hypothetical protein [Dictyobacter aurantiacus]
MGNNEWLTFVHEDGIEYGCLWHRVGIEGVLNALLLPRGAVHDVRTLLPMGALPRPYSIGMSTMHRYCEQGSHNQQRTGQAPV